MFFKWKPKKGLKSEPIRFDVNYFVKGKKVIFDLDGLDFTFEGFYVFITEEALQIIVNEEVPMNLIFITQVVESEVSLTPNELENADTVSFTLQLNAEVFDQLKEMIMAMKDIKEIFDLDPGQDGDKPLRKFSNYDIVKVGSKQTLYDGAALD